MSVHELLLCRAGMVIAVGYVDPSTVFRIAGISLNVKEKCDSGLTRAINECDHVGTFRSASVVRVIVSMLKSHCNVEA